MRTNMVMHLVAFSKWLLIARAAFPFAAVHGLKGREGGYYSRCQKKNFLFRLLVSLRTLPHPIWSSRTWTMRSSSVSNSVSQCFHPHRCLEDSSLSSTSSRSDSWGECSEDESGDDIEGDVDSIWTELSPPLNICWEFKSSVIEESIWVWSCQEKKKEKKTISVIFRESVRNGFVEFFCLKNCLPDRFCFSSCTNRSISCSRVICSKLPAGAISLSSLSDGKTGVVRSLRDCRRPCLLGFCGCTIRLIWWAAVSRWWYGVDTVWRRGIPGLWDATFGWGGGEDGLACGSYLRKNKKIPR